VFPLVCGSATLQIGVDRMLDLICEVGPSPLDRKPFTVLAGDQPIEVTPEPEGDALAFVFKSVADRHVGQLSMLKVLSGHVHHDDHLVDTRTSGDVRLHTLLTMKGGEQAPTDEAVTGDILAVAKLTDVHTNDTLAPKGKPVVVPRIGIPDPTLPVAIKAHTQADDDKLSNAVARLLDEDPSLRLERNDETHQTVLWSQGETHLRSSIDRLQRKFGVSVDTEDVQVAYRETISGSAEAEGRHKKQSGGRGQYGVCYLRVAPRDRGDGFEFVDAIVGGAIPRQYIPAVEKGIAETMAEGGVLGFPVVDVQVTCYDGKFHAVDSDEMSFKIAGRQGFKEACQKATPVLLEPVSRVEIAVPTEAQGDVLGDLNARRGRVQGTEAGDDGEQVIVAYVPTAELLRYAIDLRSLSGGRGRFSAEHDHYDPVPSHLAEKVIADTKS
jgi:elongation factor G